ncbi:MAG: hemolysin III family protein [Rhodospirillales bacterium]|nr:hemolysin III family protein [Rhodospirillales bacterium]
MREAIAPSSWSPSAVGCLLTFIGRLADSVSTTTLVLLIVGGVLFTAGAGFYLAAKLPFHNAIWHAFVLAAAGCHYAAVYLTLRA